MALKLIEEPQKCFSSGVCPFSYQYLLTAAMDHFAFPPHPRSVTSALHRPRARNPLLLGSLATWGRPSTRYRLSSTCAVYAMSWI